MTNFFRTMRSVVLGILPVLLVAACADDKITVKQGACPQVAIIRDLDAMRDYGGEPPAKEEFVAEAKLLGIEGDCAFTDEGIDIAFDLNMAALRGPRLGGNTTTFPVVVGVIDPAGKLLQRELFTTKFWFADGERTSNAQENLHVLLPILPDEQKNAHLYRVLVGFRKTSASAQ